eukprot:CAMPEP_0177479848 /NCGR_PEP_ID=MMETSP0369-20130122/25482_1 /TAXON_ID=447022 ORGANISM="Scrippsiella hangoei-like, Strain SHHI-4" /NCGR_SAMPLE_ID=MMETSP0369 /ASSEMBLY_ACC=CAM_ASM_000364 /LENGTH=50 /DNA_ID=CAMNT_0018955459 /DNA_START=18 /DNA_END=170 /DNA_ORIENTATION=-
MARHGGPDSLSGSRTRIIDMSVDATRRQGDLRDDRHCDRKVDMQVDAAST